ncbi:MAG: FtsK/SpoIIIE domain-containing protein [Arthrobacter oryzae]
MLHCTLVPAPGSRLAHEPVELAIDAPPGLAGRHLQAALTRRYGTGGLFIQGLRLTSLVVGERPLINGAILVDGLSGIPRPTAAGASAAAALALAVHGGPAAGTIFALHRGQFRIGRSGTDIVIPDAGLSREHARLDVSESSVTLADLGSANGTFVDGLRVRSCSVTTASVIRCGDSTMSLGFGTGTDRYGPEETGLGDAGGTVDEPIVVRNGVTPVSPAALILTAALPLLAGVGLAVFTGMWMFLAFTAVSAVSILAPAVSGRRQRRELREAVAAAAQQDRQRRRRSAPSAADLAAHAIAGDPPPEPPASRSGPVWLRLGLAEQPANLRLEPPRSGFVPPALGLVPLVLDPSAALVTIRGPHQAVQGLVRSLVIQLAGYPLARRTRVLVHGSAETLPFPARFLPGVSLSAEPAETAASLAAGPGEGFDDGLLIILDPGGTAPSGTTGRGGRPDWPLTDPQVPAAPDPPLQRPCDAAAVLRAAAAGHGWRVIDCAPVPGPGDGTAIRLGERCGRLITGPVSVRFIPDLVPGPVFDKCCRGLAARESTRQAQPSAVPDVCALADVLPLEETHIARRWSRAHQTPGLSVPVGAGVRGPVLLDLQTDGPHLLVAGTTGSGKSEFLRTLAAGLAAGYPPERVNLLFIDFKGGSGLGPLTGLPHCVGMLTDLNANGVGRALVSLRAEVRRREQLLAAAQAPDLAAYESLALPGPPLPHLVIVIDEFRMLVEDAPAALTELMRIAAIGRSLGVHLVMATQRPQGAVTADIRANVTSCVVLRVQSDPESIDVMNSRLAAGIPRDRPGRAYLTRGNEAPEEFQTATMAAAAAPAAEADPAISVDTAREVLTGPRAAAVTVTDSWHGASVCGQPAEPTPAEAATPLVEATVRLWTARGGAPPHHPVADPLPALLPYPHPAGPDTWPLLAGPAAAPDAPPEPNEPNDPPDTVRLGRVDLPEEQRVAGLRWSPRRHGHLGLVGGAAGAADAALALTVAQLLSGPVEFHVYILDAAGRFGAAAACPRTGAVAGLAELRRAVRVLERLACEMTRRVAGPQSQDAPPLVLVIGGWGSWVSAFRSGPLSWAEDLVLDIVRDGSRAGLTVVMSGERELVTSRFFAAIPNRAFLPVGSTDEGRLAWPRLPELEPVPGRVAVFGAFVESAAATGHAGQLFEPVAPAAGHWAAVPVRVRPFRIEALPALVTVAELRKRNGTPAPGSTAAADPDPVAPGTAPEESSGGQPDSSALPQRPSSHRLLCVGVGGDELMPARVSVPAGSVSAVLGGAGAGKSTFLAVLPDLNPAVGFLRPPKDGTDPEHYWSELHAMALAGTLDRTAILLADDLDQQSEHTNALLLTLNSLGWAVIFTAGYGASLQQRVPLALNARSQGRGILIRPRTLMDGDLFGIRFEQEASPPPGRALVVSEGRAKAVQLAGPEGLRTG